MQKLVAGARLLSAFSISVSAIALTLGSSTSPASAQASLPPVTVDAPIQRPVARAVPSRSAKLRSSRRPTTARAKREPTSPASSAPRETAWGHVDGYVATHSATGSKTDTRLIETPQAISVVTADQIKDQGAQSVAQALNYTSGVVAEQRGVNMSGFEYLTGRGFQLEKYLDGLRMPNVAYNLPSYEVYNLERIEVLHGPASVLYGQGFPGGLVNLVSKRPTDKAFGEINVSAGTYNLGATSIDTGGPVDKDGKLLYRFTGVFRDNDTQVDGTHEQRISVAPAITWRPDLDTTLTVLANYQKDPNAGYYNFVPAVGTVLPNPNGQISRSLNPGEPGFDRHSREQYGIGYLFEHRLDDNLTVRQNLRYTGIKDDLLNVFAYGLGADNRTLGRYAFFNNESLTQLTNDNQIEAKFALGAVKHTAIVGFDYQNIKYNELYGNNFAVNGLDAFNPVYGAPVALPTPGGSDDARVTQAGLYAQDQMSLGGWRFMISGRQDWAAAHDFDRINNVKTDRSDSAFTWRTGVVYLFDNGVAPYASYATSFQPQIGTAYGGAAFKPTTGEQYEIGVKYQPIGWNSFVTAALFDLTQQNVLTPDITPGHIGFSTQTGAIRSRGLELEWHAKFNRNLDVVAAYTYLDNIVTASNDTTSLFSINVGTHPVGIPRNTASLWAKYAFLDGPAAGLGVGVGVRYVGNTYGTYTNVWTGVSGLGTTPSLLPDYALLDASVTYDFAARSPALKGFSLAVNARNLFDKTYVSYCQGVGLCQYGMGRTVLGTLTYRWQ
ncbi:TonB-dependent siderophore receptor [uncultured Bradyrhizobium sp.]|nr:TonB-dependent siderophore receptor [uncultured Bradyrhizobium sp.]